MKRSDIAAKIAVNLNKMLKNALIRNNEVSVLI